MNRKSQWNQQYQRWLQTHRGPSTLETARLSAATLSRRPVFSVLMAGECLDSGCLQTLGSMRRQYYDRWQLVVALQTAQLPGVQQLLHQFGEADDRIRLVVAATSAGGPSPWNVALAEASGSWVGLVQPGDELQPEALYELARLLDRRPDLDLVYTDEDVLEPDGRRTAAFFKPQWSPELSLAMNYVSRFSVYRRTLVEQLGALRNAFGSAQDYDLALRVTELTHRIGHIPKPLLSRRRCFDHEVQEREERQHDDSKRALAAALSRRGRAGAVLDGITPGTYRVKYAIEGAPSVAIIIPTRDRIDLLKPCIESISTKTAYQNYSVTILDNQSRESETINFLNDFQGKVIEYDHEFNFSRMMNFAAQNATEDILLFLNNDVEVITPHWIEAMLEHAQHPEVGIVGVRLFYPDGSVHHEGITLGMRGITVAHIDFAGYHSLGDAVREVGAVTGACMMARRALFEELGGFDERLRVGYNDVDLCLRAWEQGYSVLYTPYALLYHVTSASRGSAIPRDDERRFCERWGVAGVWRDPFFSPHLDWSWPVSIGTSP